MVPSTSSIHGGLACVGTLDYPEQGIYDFLVFFLSLSFLTSLSLPISLRTCSFVLCLFFPLSLSDSISYFLSLHIYTHICLRVHIYIHICMYTRIEGLDFVDQWFSFHHDSTCMIDAWEACTCVCVCGCPVCSSDHDGSQCPNLRYTVYGGSTLGVVLSSRNSYKPMNPKEPLTQQFKDLFDKEHLASRQPQPLSCILPSTLEDLQRYSQIFRARSDSIISSTCHSMYVCPPCERKKFKSTARPRRANFSDLGRCARAQDGRASGLQAWLTPGSLPGWPLPC